MRLVSLALTLSSSLLLAGCFEDEPETGGRPTSDGSSDATQEDNPEEENTDEGVDVGSSDEGGSSSSGMNGSNSLYIVNYSSYDMCYIAACDCNLDVCYEDTGFYLPSGYYSEYTDLEDACVYVYVEDCDYGYYWENFLDIYQGDYTWELYD